MDFDNPTMILYWLFFILIDIIGVKISYCTEGRANNSKSVKSNIVLTHIKNNSDNSYELSI